MIANHQWQARWELLARFGSPLVCSNTVTIVNKLHKLPQHQPPPHPLSIPYFWSFYRQYCPLLSIYLSLTRQ